MRLSRLIFPVVMLALMPVTGWSQTGTLQIPGKSLPDVPPKPPAAAPRAPVQKAGPHPDAPHAAPVVRPHGQTHAQKPPVVSTPKKPVPPETPVTPPAVVPAAPTPLPAGKTAEGEKLADKVSRLPRFASLRSDEVNLRSGPGTRYRIDWVYKRRDLPVEIEREFDVWRLIRDSDGIQGWVNQATLTGRRSFIVKNEDAILRNDPKDSASAVATLKVGVIGRIRSCEKDSDWCQIQVAGHRGYLRRTQIWGLLPAEVVAP